MSEVEETQEKFSDTDEFIEETIEKLSGLIEEVPVTEPPKEITKGKKPRSPKQIEAFKKARAKLMEKRILLKSQSEESRALAKSERYKSKKNKKLTSEVKEIMGKQRLMTEEDVISIINSQKELRKQAKAKHSQDVNNAMKLLGISSLDGAKKIRKPRTPKPKVVKPPPETVSQPISQPEPVQPHNPPSYFSNTSDW